MIDLLALAGSNFIKDEIENKIFDKSSGVGALKMLIPIELKTGRAVLFFCVRD
jgi:hypothetical protein